MFSCFSKKKAPKIINPPRPLGTVGNHNGMPVALVIGHNEKSQGAVNYLGESEYLFNKRIANKIQQKLLVNGIKTAIIERPTGSYKNQCRYVADMCGELDAYMSLHLHFNSAEGRAKGCESLVLKDNGPASTLGGHIALKLAQEHGFDVRHDDGVKEIYKGHNGYQMLKAVRDANTIPVLVEPTFAHYRHKESVIIFEQEDKYVDVLVDALYMIVRGEV